jgi:cold shock CspA family protein
MTDKEYTGIVKFYNDSRSFGFITSEIYPGEHPIDVFYHKSNLSDPDTTPKIGDLATFTLVKDANGRIKAYNVYLSSPEDGEKPDAIKV